MDPVFATYLQAKLASEDRILPRTALDTVVLRPGRLTDEPGTGRVTLGHGLELGEVPRDDVAAVLVALLDQRRPTTWWRSSAAAPRSPRRSPPSPSRAASAAGLRVTAARAASWSSGG